MFLLKDLKFVHHIVEMLRQLLKWKFKLAGSALPLSDVLATLGIEALIRSIPSHESVSSDISTALLADSCRACQVDIPMFHFFG